MKYLVFCSVAFVGLLASCNGKNNDNQTNSNEVVVVEDVYTPTTEDETYTTEEGNGDGRTSGGAYNGYMERVEQDNRADNNDYNRSDYYGD